MRSRVRSTLSLIRYFLYPGLRVRLQGRLYKLAVAASPLRSRAPVSSQGGGVSLLVKKNRTTQNPSGSVSRQTALTTGSARRGETEAMLGDGGGEGGAGWSKYVRAATQYATSAGGQTEGSPREPGARRRRLASALQAANTFGQSYYGNRSAVTPGMETVRSADEELLLFPSYARMKPKPKVGERIIRREGLRESAPSNSRIYEDLEDRGSDQEEDIVEVDVRGWLYSPHSGPLSRKNKMSIWVARQLCGLPALPPSDQSTGVGGETPSAEEAEVAKQTASAIASGPYTNRSLAPSVSALDGIAYSTPAARRPSWRTDDTANNPQLTPSEIRAAHEAFQTRLAPFTHRPIANAPVTVFFYNTTASQSRSLSTSENGHFSVRAGLPFVPTHVRVLASETLSATQEITVSPAEGISLISDIDDTVKHSGISQGTREIFKNTFTAPIESFNILGVADWYKTLAGPPYNVSMHYISNSPWQLYPLLKSFFTESGLPPGSFHLKQYSGMLQGIFEPAAERKKGTLERVIKDFPNRKWVLVGDSGEADLEVYTEIAERWPNKVLAVCIRDVTSITVSKPSPPGFFDANEKTTYGGSRGHAGQAPPPLPVKRQDRERFSSSDPSLPLPPPQATPRTALLKSKPSVSSLASSASTLSVSSAPGSSAPSRPEKPPNLRGPPIPKKPVDLQPKPSTLPPRPPPPRRRHTGSLDDPSYPRSSKIPPPPLPVRTATSPRPPQRVSTATVTAAPASAALDPTISKKQEVWQRRWEYAHDRLERKGVRLLSWRVGSDVKDDVLRIVAKELGVNSAKGG
jgi:phosphatidate phosphatase APP1